MHGTIVLDLDETLVHTYDGNEIERLSIFGNPQYMDLWGRVHVLRVEDATTRRGEGVVTYMWMVTRPHLAEFLDYCSKRFSKVVVWSAGRKRYVNAAVNAIFKDTRRPNIIMAYETFPEVGSQGKPLAMVCARDRSINLASTLFLDDRETNGSSNPGNLIVCPPYMPSPRIDGLRAEDTALLDLMDWLDRPEVIKARDVRNLSKDGIFY